MPAIVVSDLVVRYGDLTAVGGVSFTVERGEVVVLLGPNGAGKTSTVEVLEGYRRPAAGSARVLDTDPTEQTTLARRVGVMLQDGGVYPTIRTGEVTELFCAYHDGHAGGGAGGGASGDRRRRADELLALVGLTERRRATWRQLSGGERQRLSLALALAGRPEVVFLDEPTSGVDVNGRRVVRQVVRDLAAGGCAVLLTTHELDEAERLADRVLIMDRGRLVADGSLADLRARTRRDEVRFRTAPDVAVDLAALSIALGVPVDRTEPGRYVIEAAPAPALVAALTAWLADASIALDGLDTGGAGLEELFLRLTGEGAA